MGLLKILAGLSLSVSLWADAPPIKDWRVGASLSNFVGVGSFIAGYAAEPSWSTSLALNPSYKLPVFWGMPRITVAGNVSMMMWWLASYQTTALNYDHRVSFTDIGVDLSMPEILAFGPGFSFGASLGLNVPTSVISRAVHRIVGINAGLPIKWSKWGFSVGLTPAATGWVYSQSNITGPCFQMPQTAINPQNINADMGQLSQGLVIVRNQEENFGDGTCLTSGRQIIWTLNNMLSLGWSNPNHSVGVGLGWFVNFLRPLQQRPEVSSEFSTGQNFTEATLGRIAYTYRVPIETELSFGAGVMSIQSSRTGAGDLAFPFFDFVTPGNNQTQIFFQATVGI
ncbi:MAG: hypothetical protein V4534_06215 [Myxococcota bacterium]